MTRSKAWSDAAKALSSVSVDVGACNVPAQPFQRWEGWHDGIRTIDQEELESAINRIRRDCLVENSITKAAEKETEEAKEEDGMAMRRMYMGWLNTPKVENTS